MHFKSLKKKIFFNSCPASGIDECTPVLKRFTYAKKVLKKEMFVVGKCATHSAVSTEIDVKQIFPASIFGAISWRSLQQKAARMPAHNNANNESKEH